MVAALAVSGSAVSDTGTVTAPPASVTSAQPSWTARIVGPVAARGAPTPGARVRMRLMPYTAFSRRPQVLMVTGSMRDAEGRLWVRVNLPRRPNGSSAWVPGSAVRLAAIRGRILVRVGSRRVEVWRAGRRLRSFPAAVGKPATPTPLGSFAVQDPVASSPTQRSYLGPHIITLTAYSTVLTSFMGGNGLVAIHGAANASTLRRPVSNGCIRVTDEAVTVLSRFVTAGMPVDIVPG